MMILNANAENAGEICRICVSSADELTLVDVNNIIYCESKRNYTVLHLTGQRKLLASKTLGSFEALLSTHNFCRVHHSYLINMLFVKCFKKVNGGFVLMQDETPITVSVRKKEAFLKHLKEMSHALF